MTLSQFDLADHIRCRETDEQGFRCALHPSHDGRHIWARCDHAAPHGPRCMLPPGHPGDHEFFWFDQPAAEGAMWTISYSGAERDTRATADRTAAVAARRGWVEKSRSFRLGPVWRSPLARLLGLFLDPEGRLTIVFEYRPT